MNTSNNTSLFNENKRLALIDAIGQLEAFAAVYFNLEKCSDTKRLDFYIAMLFTQLIHNAKSLINEMLDSYQQVI